MSYVYSLATDFTTSHNISIAEFIIDVKATNISQTLSNIYVNGDAVTVTFLASLSSGEQTTLTTVVHNHVAQDPPTPVRATQLATTGSDIIISDADPGVAGQVLQLTSPTTAAWLTLAGISTVTQVIYVNKGGNDSTGNGSISLPYLTIATANTSITDASGVTPKRYIISIGPGDYSDSFALKANVFLVGTYTIGTRLTGTITLNDSSWTTADNRSGFKDLQLTTSQTFDFTTQSSSEGKLYFYNVRLNGITFVGFNAINQALFFLCEFFSNYVQTAVACYLNACFFNPSLSVTLNPSSLTGNITAFTAHGTSGGSLTLTATSNSTNAVQINLYNSVMSTINLNGTGAGCTLNATVSSLPTRTNITLSNGATITRLNDAYGLAYTPTTNNSWTSVPTTVQSGLDNINTGLSSLFIGTTTYSTGTASQSTTTITGSGTTFTTSMIGGTIVYANGVIAYITGFTSTTSLTSSKSQTVTNQAFTLYYGGLSIDNTGSVGLNRMNISNLTASQAVVTDASKNLASLAYTSAATVSTIMSRDANANTTVNNLNLGFSPITTSGGTTTLTVASADQTYFTGSSAQTVVMPVASTLSLGADYLIFNQSTGLITVQSSGANTITTIPPNASVLLVCVLASGTTAASWSYAFSNSAYSLLTATGAVTVGTATAPTVDQAFIATSGTAGTWQNVAPSCLEDTGVTTYTTGTASQATTTVTGSGTTFTASMTGGTLVWNYYSTGTASQSGTTITGSGTTWTSTMASTAGTVYIIYANGWTSIITGFTSTTSLTASVSQTVSSQAYVIYVTANITAFVSATSLTVSPSQTIAAQAFTIYYTPQFSTTSATYVPITGISQAIGSNSYLGKFNCSVSVSNATAVVWVVLSLNGVPVQASKTRITPASTTLIVPVSCQGKMTSVLAGSTLTAQVCVTGGFTVTVHNTSLEVLMVK